MLHFGYSHVYDGGDVLANLFILLAELLDARAQLFHCGVHAVEKS
jgi:hypothetical protein